MATPTFILPSAPTYTEGFVNGLNVYPNPTNFVANQVPFTRATTATRTNAAGLIELVPYNLFSWSEMFTNAIWNKQQASILPNIVNAPNGTLTADKLVPDTTSAQHRIFSTASFSGAGTLSVYAKADGYNFLSLGYGGGAFGDTIIFNLSNGTISGTSAGFTPIIESVGNGWYRCSASNPSLGINSNIGYWIIARNANSTADYVGDGTSGVLIWGAQLVEGTSALPYQLTETRLNRPRVDFSLGGCPSLLLEPQRTNLALWSEDFSNVIWVKGASTITANTTTSPSGISNADTFTGDGNLDLHLLGCNVVSPIGVTSISIYAKKNTNNFIQLIGGIGTFGSNVWANFDLNSGVVGSVGSSTTASIQNVGNGWYRCTIVGTSTLAISPSFNVSLITSATSPRAESNSLSTSVFLWGAQLELGAYPTSYVPTTAATVTRNTDSFQLSNIFTNNMISSAGGTWFVDLRNNIVRTRDNTTTSVVFGDVTGTNTFFLRADFPTDRISILKRTAGVPLLLFTTTATTCKIAIKWNGSTADIFQNGVKVITANSFSSTNLESLVCQGTNIPLNINSMALWNTPLTDDELEVITGEGFDTYALMASNYNYILQ